MKYIVYQTTNLKNNKIYIGVHKTIDSNKFDGYIGCGIRLNNPSSYMNPTTPLQYAVKKYGTSLFKRITIAEFDNLEEAFELETKLVNHNFINRNDTYNAKLGGQGGCSYYIKINQFDLKGNLLKTWNSIVEASEFYCISTTAIHNANKFKGSCKKYFWSTENKIHINEYSYLEGQTCYKYNSDGKFIELYNSLVEASKDNNTSLQSIQRAVKGGYKVGEFYYSNELYDYYLGKPKISLKNKTIYIYDLNGKYLTSLHSGEEIKKYFDIKSTSSITTAIRTNRQYKNFQISLDYYDSLNPVEDKRNIKKIIEQYDLVGNLLNTYNSITEAVKIYGTGVQKVLKGQQQQCKGFIFKYKS